MSNIMIIIISYQKLKPQELILKASWEYSRNLHPQVLLTTQYLIILVIIIPSSILCTHLLKANPLFVHIA